MITLRQCTREPNLLMAADFDDGDLLDDAV